MGLGEKLNLQEQPFSGIIWERHELFFHSHFGRSPNDRLSGKRIPTEVIFMTVRRSYYQFNFFVRHTVFPAPDMISLMLERYKGYLPSVRCFPAMDPGLPPVRSSSE